MTKKLSMCLSVFAGLFVLAGCASDYDPMLRENPNFSLGYNDGCQTGNARVTGFDETVYRDKSLFEADRAYQAGWREGYTACGGNNYNDQDVFGGEDKWYDKGPL